MKSTITFYGGAGSVTGANFMLDTGSAKIVVDCGAVAQERVCDDTNFAQFAYDPSSITALFITHAHQDHIGRIPRLVREGYRGPIYSTAPTKDISAVMFDDALSIMAEEMKQHGCDMLYEKEDATQALSQWRTVSYHEPLEIGDATVALMDAGHILGSALVRISRYGRSIVFTGDLGNVPEPLLNDTESPEGADYLVMESVYGDRTHDGRDERKTRLKEAIETTRSQGGTLIIPSFSLERTQVLLYEINSMVEDKAIDPIPMFLDSPLASRITEIFRRYPEFFNKEASERIRSGDDPFSFPGLVVTESGEASRAIHHADDPKVIIAGAGMSGGGRVRSHEKYYLGSKKAAMLFIGYQAPGTLGRRLQDGAPKVQIDGQYYRVHARVDTLSGYSGHADRDQLMQFVENAGPSLKTVFVTMGENKSSLFLAQRIKDFFGIDAQVPKKNESIDIEL